MIKLILKLCFICSFMFVTTLVQAGIIPSDISTITPDLAPSNTGEVSQDSYITHYDAVTDTYWDIAWASDVNSELFFDGGIYNTLFSADTHADWITMPVNASTGELDIFVGWDGSDILDLFRIDATNFIHAFEYWNSEFLFPLDGNDVDGIKSGAIRSEMALTWNDYISVPGYSINGNNNFDGATFNTFYFRVHENASTPIPEPSTLMIFSLSLIVLASKKRLFN